jgi:hypothetical protein
LGLVDHRTSGTGLTESDWLEYTNLLRQRAKQAGLTPRRLDYSLWLFHQCLYPDAIPDRVRQGIPDRLQSSFSWLLD